MISATIKIEVDNISVEDNYFEFEYKVYVDENLTVDDIYSGDHVWNDDKKWFQKLLEEKYAFELVLNNLDLQ